MATPFLSSISYIALRIWGLRINKTGHQIKKGENFLIVGNHLSYLDVLIYATMYPCCFVTSVEVRDTFFLGHLCKLGGCVFVERRNRKGLRGEIKEIEDALAYGLNVIVFPEATSTNGESVLRFKRPLFQSAITVGKDVLPVVLNYTKINNKGLSIENRDLLFWYGDMEFAPHFWKFLNLDSIRCEVKTLPPITDTDSREITDLSETAHALIEKDFNAITS